MAEAKFRPAESYERELRRFQWGPIAMEKLDDDDEAIQQERYSGKSGTDYTDKHFYTYRSAIVEGAGLTWNPQRCQTDDEKMLAELLAPGLYSFYPDSSRTGWAILPELAAEMPEDVTTEYAGQMGIAEGETGKAWRIALNKDARWSLTDKAMSWIHRHGDVTMMDFDITADDYLYSLRQLLDPRLDNPGAARFCEGEFALYNAVGYRESGKTTYEPLEITAEEALASGLSLYLDMDFWNLAGAPDEQGRPAPQYVSIEDDTRYLDSDITDINADDAWMSAKALFDSFLANGMPYESYQRAYLRIAHTAPLTTWEDVGIRKTDDYTIDLIFAEPVTDADWRLPYGLRDGWLVFEPLYEACKSYYDAEGKQVKSEDDAFTISTIYGTDFTQTASYGPYAMTRSNEQEGIFLARDDSWYGYRDDLHTGMYQTDAVEIVFLPDHASVMNAFLRGELDDVVLIPSEVSHYEDSPYLRFFPDSQTTKLTLNTDYDKLLGRGDNSQLLVVDEFREALACAIDRDTIALICGGRAAHGLLSSSYIWNPVTGASYRESAPGRQVVDTRTTYNPEKARSLMQLAYDRAVAAGIYDGLSPIAITIRVEREDDLTRQVFSALQEQISSACAGTALEPYLKLKMAVDAHCYETNYGGDADAIFSTWSGSTLDPYSIMGACYTDSPDGSGQQMEYGYNTGVISLTIDCDGQQVTASLRGWARWTRGDVMTELDEALGHFSDYSYTTRSAILAGMEACCLNWNATIPLYDRGKTTLFSQRYVPAVDKPYNPVVRDGGLAFTTYQYDDGDWAAYIQEHELNY